VLATIAIVSLWTPMSHPAVAARWFSLPIIVFFAPVPILVLLVTWAILRPLRQDSHAAPFLFALVLLFLGYSGLAISLWPNIIPPSISIWDAAAPPESMGFTLVGALFIIPFILAYTT
jgi:cytochrome d ubiquinol oxidase subunit II